MGLEGSEVAMGGGLAVAEGGENGACPPTRSGSIHPLLSRKSG